MHRVLVCLLLGISLVYSQYSVQWKQVSITSWDGTVLAANAGIPVPKKTGEVFPAVVMANSWGAPVFEYIVKTLQWAEAGYVVLEYETRGFYNSGGDIDTAGPKDQKDFISVLDFLVSAGWNVDTSNIGTCGISYGAGIAVLGAAVDSRVKTAVALSGWGNMTTSLYDGQAPSLIWGDVLIEVGKIVGKEPAEIVQLFDQLLAHENISGVKAWADLRSPEALLKSLQQRNVSVFISNNFEDRLFKPDAALKYFQHLGNIPKYMLLNQGIHATAEIGGLVGLPNFVWSKVTNWMDYWLKGIQTGIMKEPSLHFQHRNSPNVYVSFKSWPDPSVVPTTYLLSPRDSSIFGSLIPSDVIGNGAGSDTISYSEKSGLFAGVPILGELLQVWVDIPIVTELFLTSRAHSLVYVTKPMQQKTRLCGIPNVTLSVTPNSGSYQVITYLYDVDVVGAGILISHGPANNYNATPGVPTTMFISQRTLCYDVPEGHAIGLGISMFSEMYQPANTDPSLTMSVNTDNNKISPMASFIDLPVNP